MRSAACPPDSQGQKITGVGFDRDTLVAAGVEEAYAFAAVSDGDNSNILAARVVRETYGVENVVARIADPGRAEVYQRLGIATVAPVPWTVAQIVARLLLGGLCGVYSDAVRRRDDARASPSTRLGWPALHATSRRRRRRASPTSCASARASSRTRPWWCRRATSPT